MSMAGQMMAWKRRISLPIRWHVGGPGALEARVVDAVVDGADVVEQGVEPDVHHLALVEGQRDAPGEGLAADALVGEPLPDEADHLVAAHLRLDELGVGLDVLQQAVGVGGEAEEVVVLLHHLHLPAALGALAVHELGGEPEGLVGHAVPALVGIEVDVPLVVELLDEVARHLGMAGRGGADEDVVADVQLLPHVGEMGHHAVRPLLGRDVVALRGARDVLAVLVGAGEEEDLARP